ncbi:FtsX-like permease family protein [Streptomyces sp. URMC 129]|uniref:FtsX-like permease family protein n=1 Tax=Streptomyces sp. URMC 129 TaxID=3423407 RepID=UPI003F1CFBF8
MIALPILGVTAADLAVRSSELSQAEQLTREMGQADARFRVETGGEPVLQSPEGDALQFPDTVDTWTAALTRPLDEVTDRLRATLPPGTEILADHTVEGLVDTEDVLLATEVRELDAAHPATEGMITLLSGRYPEGPGEIAATEAFLDESGLRVGAELRIRDDDRSYRVTGAYELPDRLDQAQLLALPGAVLPLPEGGAGWQGPATLLAVVPDGGVTWPMVMAANEHGLSAESRAVLADPPADADVPLWDEYGPPGSSGSGVDSTVVAATVTAVSLVILEICLLAGPAFAVGARRSRRQLGLVGANGGDRHHLRAVMLAGGAVLGAVAAAIGVAGGIALTLAAHPLIEEQGNKRFGAWDFRVAELAGIAVLAVVVGLLAAVIPAVNAARSSVLDSLTGRRGVRRANRVLPVIGLAVLVLGTATALLGSLVTDSTVVVAAGAVTAELGLVALTPVLVGAAGRLGRWLPLSARLALRDATRNRGRTAPAVAAVLAAVAGSVVVATMVVSGEAENRAEYVATLPTGGVSLAADFPDQRDQLDAARAAAERELPTAERADLFEVVAGDPECDSSDVAESCGLVELVVPPERECPLWTEDADRLTAEERGGLSDDPRCARATALLIDERGVWVGGPEALGILGVGDDEVRRAADALERGEAVVFTDRFVSGDGEVRVNLWDVDPWEEDGAPTPPDHTATFAAHLVEGAEFGLSALISPAAAEAAGLTTVDAASFFATTEMPGSGEQLSFEQALAALGTPPAAYIEDGYDGDPTAVLLILALVALVITLGAAGIATGLAQADSEADLTTLASVGASPRVRRTLSGLQCGVIAAMGVLLGSVAGLIPALGLRLDEHRKAVSAWEWNWEQGWDSGPRPELFIELPWATFAQLIVVVPLIACAVAALLTRSRIPLARRAG